MKILCSNLDSLKNKENSFNLEHFEEWLQTEEYGELLKKFEEFKSYEDK